MKIPDGLTLRVTSNVKEKTTRIMAYRQGGFKRAYKAVLPMCVSQKCHLVGPHKLVNYRGEVVRVISYHQRDVDMLVGKLIKSYR